MRWLCIIPAHLASKRLPEKMLLDVEGLPLIKRTYDNLQRIRDCNVRTVVATDSAKIVECCIAHNMDYVSTGYHGNGTSRCIEVAYQIPAEFYLNVQGDMCVMDDHAPMAIMTQMQREVECGMVTACHLGNSEQYRDPSCVKVVCDRQDRAMYFSRAPIPYRTAKYDGCRVHLGVYAYKRLVLQEINYMQTDFDGMYSENLEQLKPLSNGVKIKVVDAGYGAISVDTEDDLRKAREYYASSN